ncbi:DeoR/GlpR transcriptional regulator [Streptomyces durbertensis]|uniref:DeoR/GlpR transcriptional regulator n=1 Tax=Streptomyces durbertensis TaxID=2448886 RepID=A0ABR6EJG1_9ACTN|nr:DeoR/GlpR family DNA-binding transcription regulator [Streptomyces durbertensis]MBB1245476.1 DeoR/GlpR transcriptional regulator [Streptomyces durbertensis]
MSKPERWQTLLERLAEDGRLDVEEAAGVLGVSSATIRRDLDELAEQQMLVRTRGGAVAHGVSYELPLRYKSTRRAAEKRRIAAAVADLIGDNEVVGLNGGTTTTEVARTLAHRAGAGGREGGRAVTPPGSPVLTVVTNALNIAGELAVRPHIKTVTTGGVARPQTYELVGSLTMGVLSEVVLDAVVLGVDGVDARLGVMAHHEDEAAVSRLFVERAQRVVVATDSSKLGRRAFARICGLDRVDVLVTDTGVSEEAAARLGEAGVRVVSV